MLATTAAKIRKHATAMEKPSRGGDETRYLLANYQNERSHLGTGLNEVARLCGD